MKLKRAFLKGAPAFVSSKSCLIRAIMSAFVSNRESRIKNFARSDDVMAALGLFDTFETPYRNTGGGLNIYGRRKSDDPVVRCGASAAVLRFSVPVLAAFGKPARFEMDESLANRSHEPMFDFLRRYGVTATQAGRTIICEGKLNSNELSISGATSTQYISGALFALAAMGGGALTTNDFPQSGYISMTINYLRRAGYHIDEKDRRIVVEDSDYRRSRSRKIYDSENCFSSNAYWLAGGAINGDIRINALCPDSRQPDASIIDALRLANSDICADNEGMSVSASDLRGFNYDAKSCPDLLPTLAAIAANAKGESVLEGMNRLQNKECNRAEAICNMLDCLGVIHRLRGDELRILGSKRIKASRPIKTYNDHRMVMAATIATLKVEGEVEIENPEAVSKSYPGFFVQYKLLSHKE